MSSAFPPQPFCSGDAHFSRGNQRRCLCGRTPNPARRNWRQRRQDKREMRAIRREQNLRGRV